MVGERKRKGIRIGKPAFWTRVAIHLLFPPLLKYSLPKSVAADWPERTRREKMTIWIHHLYCLNFGTVKWWLTLAFSGGLASLASSPGTIT